MVGDGEFVDSGYDWVCVAGVAGAFVYSFGGGGVSVDGWTGSGDYLVGFRDFGGADGDFADF